VTEKCLGFFHVLSASPTVSRINIYKAGCTRLSCVSCHVKPQGLCQTTTTTTTTTIIIIIIFMMKLKSYHMGALLSIWLLPSYLPNRPRPSWSQNIPGGISHTSQQQHTLKYTKFKSAVCIKFQWFCVDILLQLQYHSSFCVNGFKVTGG
jgi:hypothetical protein